MVRALTAVAPASANTAQGWTVDSKVAPNFCFFRPGNSLPYSAFTATEPTAFSQYGYRTPDPISGVFAAGAWRLDGKVRNNNYYNQTGYVKFRLWKSEQASGAAAVQVTDGWQASTVLSFTATYQYQTFSIFSGAIAEQTFDGEYLFLEVEWSAVNSGLSSAAFVSFVDNESVECLVGPGLTVPPVAAGGAVIGGEAPVGMRVSMVPAGGAVSGGAAPYHTSPIPVDGLAYSPEPVRATGLRFA